MIGSDPFDAFWAAYPRKIAKQAARRAYVRGSLVGDGAAILRALEDQKRSRAAQVAAGAWVPDWPHASTWINGARWEDQVEAPAAVAGDTVAPVDDGSGALLAAFRREIGTTPLRFAAVDLDASEPPTVRIQTVQVAPLERWRSQLEAVVAAVRPGSRLAIVAFPW